MFNILQKDFNMKFYNIVFYITQSALKMKKFIGHLFIADARVLFFIAKKKFVRIILWP